jgi:hypothetical protein
VGAKLITAATPQLSAKAKPAGSQKTVAKKIAVVAACGHTVEVKLNGRPSREEQIAEAVGRGCGPCRMIEHNRIQQANRKLKSERPPLFGFEVDALPPGSEFRFLKVDDHLFIGELRVLDAVFTAEGVGPMRLVRPLVLAFLRKNKSEIESTARSGG